MSENNLLDRDRDFVWHPFTQMKIETEVLPIVRAKDTSLFTENGDEYLDLISSWWVTIHGHSNEYIAKKIYEQATTLEHVIFAGVTHPKAVEVSERVLNLLPEKFTKAFFSDNGSTSVEVGIKMALQYWYNKGQKRDRLVAIEGSYHGDTFGSMSVSARGGFNEPFENHMFDVDFIPFPTKDNFEEVKTSLINSIKDGNTAAFIFEPLVQGSAGMRMYSEEQLDELMQICKDHNVLCIADEVMTGWARTGKLFATDYCNNKPDIMALSKGITGGVMAIGVTVATEEIFEAFLHDEKARAFLHGHSFTANPMACAAVCANLDLFEQEATWNNINRIGEQHAQFIAENDSKYDHVTFRQKGTILALEIDEGEGANYFSSIGKRAFPFFKEKGLLMRPLGNVIYLNPPYCTTNQQLDRAYKAIIEFLAS